MVELRGEELADHAAALASCDPNALDRAALLERIASLEQLKSRVQALQNDALDAFQRVTIDPEYPNGEVAEAHRSATSELGLVLQITGGSATTRMHRARNVATKLPTAEFLLAGGSLSTAHVDRLASAAINVDAEVSRDAEELVFLAGWRKQHPWRTPAELARAYTQAVLEIDPDGGKERAREARLDRHVRLDAEPDGMATMSVYLPAEDANAVAKAVDDHARTSLAANTPGDTRTLTQRRADAFVEQICGTGGNTEGEGTAGKVGRQVVVNVTVSWSTLIGLDDAPADLAGYGPIDAATARRIAADPTATWRRLLLDPESGRLLDHGRTRYRPPQDLKDFVIARDTCCRFPGCPTPATVCDLDHRLAWDDHGRTAPGNLDPLCRNHHRLKHQEGWHHHRDPVTGESTWTTPTGLRIDHPTPELPLPPPVEPPAPTPTPPPEDPGPPPF